AGGAQQGVLITAQNAGLLPPGFAVSATADPAGAGGTYVSLPAANGTLIDASGRLTLSGLAPGTYDLAFQAPAAAAAPSAGALALAPALVSGVSVGAGQAVDVGVVTLFAGAYVAGQVTDAATGLPVANLAVSARPSASASGSSGSTAATFSATTDPSGRYLLSGLDPAQNWYDVTAAPRGALVSGQPLPPYAARRALSVSVASGAVVNFALEPANSVVTGRVVAPNGAALTASLPGAAAAPGAVVYLQTAGMTPTQDPLADLALQTNPDGTFSIPSVATGSYQLMASALGQGSAVAAVVVASSSTNLGAVTLGSGGVVRGAVRLPNGTSPPSSQVLSMAAIASDSSDFQYAALTLDPSGAAVAGYAIGGMTPGKTYRLVVSGPGGAYVPPEAAALVLASSSSVLSVDLTLRPPAGPVSFRASRGGAGWNLTTIFPQPLRALTPADSDPSLLLTTAPAEGVLSGGALSADRLTVTATYAPGAGETTAVFLASATLAGTDWSSTNPSAAQLTVGATAALQVVGDGLTRQTIVNGLGGTLTFDGDAGRVVLPRGAFNADAAAAVGVSFSRSASPAAYAALAPPPSAASALYDVALPAGVPASLARPATLTLAYSTSVANPAALNVYWYNPASETYVLQPDVLGGAPVVDAVARTVTERVNHFSTYILLDSAAGAIGGAASSVGALTAYNFPNPFDLSYKTVTTIHGGGAPTIRGTLISVSLPPGLSGDGRVRIFDIVGRLLRTIDMGSLTGGQVHYQNWDGRTDFGRDVASGLYLCEIDVGGQRKIFKMAVLK
ncbi:MAG TPA: FlgD immunoglobulin-like domain containing protein, partial [Elusimicrobiota bacterium]|nr:FlgD immunoglobulin-like domain containing protein [Elusimicrobiota bacterium]